MITVLKKKTLIVKIHIWLTGGRCNHHVNQFREKIIVKIHISYTCCIFLTLEMKKQLMAKLAELISGEASSEFRAVETRVYIHIKWAYALHIITTQCKSFTSMWNADVAHPGRKTISIKNSFFWNNIKSGFLWRHPISIHCDVILSQYIVTSSYLNTLWRHQ